MPLFGKKKAQDAKKQEAAPAAQPAPYRHVPKHAASDAANHGLAESDRTAQQKRIMAASQARLNSMNSNYSVKSNFTNVPISGAQSKPYVFAASNSPRQSIGSVASKDRSVVQSGSPAGTAQPTQPSKKAQEEYVKLRNPSFLSNTAAPRSSSPKSALAVKNTAAAAGGVGSDSGYGSVGQVSRPDSKPASVISRTSDSRTSQDSKPAPRSTSGLDFLPKLDFTPERSRPPTAEDEHIVSPIEPVNPATIIAARDRAASNSSSYVSRLDPGSDRRSMASFQARPFDQIDFSKPEPQFVPPSSQQMPWTNIEPLNVARPESHTAPSERPPPAQAQETRRDQDLQHSSMPDRSSKAKSTAHIDQSLRKQHTPAQINAFTPEPEVPRENTETVVQDTNVYEQPRAEHHSGPSLQLKRDQMVNETHGKPAMPLVQEEQLIQDPTGETEPVPLQYTPSEESERGRTTPTNVVTPFPLIEQRSRDASTSQTRQSDQARSQPTRHRNWSRPSQASGSQLDYDRNSSDGGLPVPTAKPAFPPMHGASEQRENSHPPEAGLQAQHHSHSVPNHTDRRTIQTVQAPHPQVQPQPHLPQQQHQVHPQWNDQASSLYGESSYLPSTRQHSPSRRHSFAPSDILDQGQSAGQSALPPLSILDGLKVNKRGKILDEEGDVIGELVEGDIIDCVRQKANAFGQVLDDYGRVVGRVSTTARGGDRPPQSATANTRSRGFSEVPQNHVQPYMLPESRLVSPTATNHSKPFNAPQEEDPRQRAADLQAAAARRRGPQPEAQIELDGSGFAEAAPLVDHSEIFAPPFIPSRSPKRSPAEPATHTMDHYFSNTPEKKQAPPEAAPRLKKWASRNLDEDRQEMQTPTQAPPQSAFAQTSSLAAPASNLAPATAPSDHSISRPSTAETPRAERDSTGYQSEPDIAAQNFISSDQPKDIFPWMTTPPAQDTGKWSPNMFAYKGEVPGENATARQPAANIRSPATQPQNPSAWAPNGVPPAKQHALNGSKGPGSRTSKRNSHQPHVKSPLSTHSKSLRFTFCNHEAELTMSSQTSHLPKPAPASPHTPHRPEVPPLAPNPATRTAPRPPSPATQALPNSAPKPTSRTPVALRSSFRKVIRTPNPHPPRMQRPQRQRQRNLRRAPWTPLSRQTLRERKNPRVRRKRIAGVWRLEGRLRQYRTCLRRRVELADGSLFVWSLEVSWAQ